MTNVISDNHGAPLYDFCSAVDYSRDSDGFKADEVCLQHSKHNRWTTPMRGEKIALISFPSPSCLLYIG